MTISLITTTFNSQATIARTMASVLSQHYDDLEYIIIDGASTDNTREIVLSYQDQLNLKFVSEPDQGIYDAMNKGIKLATGEIIGILNSDDLFDNNQVLAAVAAAFNDPGVDAVYGDIKYFSDDINKTTRYWRAGQYRESKLSSGWIIPHPALFLRRSVYARAGLFKTDFKIAGDYELLLRLLKVYKINLKYWPEVLVRMYNRGASANNLRQRRQGWQELRQAWLVNNFKVPRFFIFRRVMFKLKQFFIF